MKLLVLLPIKRTSLRIPEKNTKPFAGVEGGLTRIKMDQLCRWAKFQELLVYTDDIVVAEIASAAVKQHGLGDRVRIETRRTAEDLASTDGLIAEVPNLWPDEPDDSVVLWTHVTSPFFTERQYQSAIHNYRLGQEAGCDSLMTVEPLRTFIYGPAGPVNWDARRHHWPATESLPQWVRVNSACFMAPLSLYRSTKDRIGDEPYLMHTTILESLDIDWADEWAFAEKLWENPSW